MANAGAEMVRELLYREQGGRESQHLRHAEACDSEGAVGEIICCSNRAGLFSPSRKLAALRDNTQSIWLSSWIGRRTIPLFRAALLSPPH